MKDAFLNRVAGYILETGNDFRDIAVVFPNRRASLFLRKHLARMIDKAVWLPDLFSVDDFMFQISGLSLIDPDDLLFECYESLLSINPDKKITFEDFADWAPQVLKDFNDIDLNLADAKKIFTYITDSKAIELWNPGKNDLSELEQKYLDFFRSLLPLYENLTERILSRSQAYQGLAYRQAANKIAQSARILPWKKIIFAGFNALTVAEHNIIRLLREEGIVQLLWDADHYYLDRNINEAGMHLREWFKNEGPEKINWISDHYQSGSKNLDILGASGTIAQVKAAARILSEIHKKDQDLSTTAIVLGDESLLIPLLNSIPQEISSMNVTMGLPYTDIPLNTLFESFIQMHMFAEKTSKGFYFRHLAGFLQHSYVRPLFINAKHQALPLVEIILNQQKIYYRKPEIQLLLNECENREKLIELFERNSNPAGLIDACIKLSGMFREVKSGKINENEQEQTADNLHNEFLYQFVVLFRKLKNNILRYSETLTFNSFLAMYRQSVRQNSFPFYGEPLKGLQIMGMLETRNLDFKNVIIINVNEDVIPKGKSNLGFIPFDVRKEFGLPTHYEGQAVSAYHFYRFLQMPENIHLIYNTEAGGIQTGGKSRYLMQISRELPEWNPRVVIRETVMAAQFNEKKSDLSLKIPKTGNILFKIRELADKGFSATALNTYRKCSLQFYFSKIEGLKEIEDPAEEIDAKTLGVILHEIMEKCYSRHTGSSLTEEIIKSFEPLLPEYIKDSFISHFPQGDFTSGKTHLFAEVSHTLLKRYLQMEIERIKTCKDQNQPVFIKGNEQVVTTNFTTSQGNNVKLYGKIDRIDQLGAEIHLFDYKSGQINDNELKLKNWEDIIHGKQNDKIFQLLFYSLLFSSDNNVVNNIKTGIISFRQLSKGYQYLQLPSENENSETVHEKFKPILSLLIDELLDPATIFRQTDETEFCKNCPFATVCYRDTANPT